MLPAIKRFSFVRSPVEIQRARNLGALYLKLGINPESRIVLHVTPARTTIWDLGGRAQFSIHSGVNGASVDTEPLVIGARLQAIIDASDEELKQKYQDSFMDGWSDERSTVFTELCYRGINVLDL
jgi:hypothetical protein